jgi:CubicO group peptidase (beta-lactamase class C family)
MLVRGFPLLLTALLLSTGVSALRAYEITPKTFALAAEFSRTHGGLALRVQQGGRVTFEDYASGFSADTPHRIYSGTKNFVAVTALIAAQEGLLNLNEPASLTLTEWRNDRRRSITLNQLLSQTSGLSPGADIIDPARDQMAAALEVHLIDPPGARFHYGPVGYQAFGEILKRKLHPRGFSVEGYMKARLFEPLHIDIASWKHDDAGNPLLHAGLWLTAAEWAKFGEFIKGEALGKTKPLVNEKLFPLLFVGHKANPAYGLAFWLNRPPPSPRLQKMADLEPAIDGMQLYPGGPGDIYAAEGTSKQRLYVIPSLDLVIVRFGYGGPFSDGDFLSRLLTGKPHPDAHTH